jgi:hypothetical protein
MEHLSPKYLWVDPINESSDEFYEEEPTYGSRKWIQDELEFAYFGPDPDSSLVETNDESDTLQLLLNHPYQSDIHSLVMALDTAENDRERDFLEKIREIQESAREKIETQIEASRKSFFEVSHQRSEYECLVCCFPHEEFQDVVKCSGHHLICHSCYQLLPMVRLGHFDTDSVDRKGKRCPVCRDNYQFYEESASGVSQRWNYTSVRNKLCLQHPIPQAEDFQRRNLNDIVASIICDPLPGKNVTALGTPAMTYDFSHLSDVEFDLELAELAKNIDELIHSQTHTREELMEVMPFIKYL